MNEEASKDDYYEDELQKEIDGWAKQTMAGCHATLSNVMFDAVFICISTRQLALLIHLKNSFSKIFQAIHVDPKGISWYTNYRAEAVEKEEIENDLTQRLKYWIRKHQTTLRLLNDLQSLYSFPLFLHFCYVGMVLATGAAAVLKGTLTSMEYYFIGMHLLGLSFTLFVICRIGDYIKIQTDEITEGLYGQNYFLLSKKQHALIKNLLTAINQPFVLRVAQAFPLSTETFKSVMTTTYSFFAMFTQMQHKN
ncbi:hypothetical protein GE061_011066 [Apolygus lucorum]|uniref:Odorant receptor n=1 Tax=Apolygus lucorum TaxID=248454 RepID=A0A8S9XWR3_APOLU|nr:hypothetical protein GE061_011066 [Apolygus lucorum]